eukprot:353338-Chlamydomonas_euryale.AAC.3
MRPAHACLGHPSLYSSIIRKQRSQGFKAIDGQQLFARKLDSIFYSHITCTSGVERMLQQIMASLSNTPKNVFHTGHCNTRLRRRSCKSIAVVPATIMARLVSAALH